MDEFKLFRFDGRVAIVAGGSGGIGTRAATAFAGVGAHVALFGRADDRLEQARAAVEAADSDALVVGGDMTKKDEADKAVSAVLERFGRSTYSSTRSAAERRRCSRGGGLSRRRTGTASRPQPAKSTLLVSQASPAR